MKKIFLGLMLACAAMFAAPVHAELLAPTPIYGVFDNSTGLAYGIVPKGAGMTTTPLQIVRSNGGQVIGTGYAASTPPANGLIVQGNVGIGTASPARTLDVVGTLGATGTATFGGAVNITGLATAAGVNSSADLKTTVANKGLVLKQGANGRTGTFVCTSGGTIVVANTSYAITDTVSTSLNTLGGSISAPPFTIANSAGVSFSMKCATSDTSTYNYTLTANAP